MIAYLLAAFGLAYIVGHSTISVGFRRFLGGSPGQIGVPELNQPARLPVPGSLGPAGEWLCELLECPACFGFWLGLVAGLAGPDVPEFKSFNPVMVGCVTSGSNFLLGRLTRLI